MERLRTIGIWMTLLLFVSGFASPLVPAVRAACPMQQAEQERHCAEAKPEPNVPLCCQKHEAPQPVLAPKDAEPANCCCHLKAAPERKEVPAMLPVEIGVAALPTVAVSLSLPQAVAVAITATHATEENAPRGPPRTLCSPRAPPLS